MEIKEKWNEMKWKGKNGISEKERSKNETGNGKEREKRKD